MSRFSFLIFFGLINLFYLSIASIDYEKEYDDIEFIPEHSNEWVVRINEGNDIADLVASELGLQNKRKVFIYFFCDSSIIFEYLDLR